MRRQYPVGAPAGSLRSVGVQPVDREALIERKHQVIADIRRYQLELNQLRLRDDRLSRGRVQELERRLEASMAEEYRLRQAIDRAR